MNKLYITYKVNIKEANPTRIPNGPKIPKVIPPLLFLTSYIEKIESIRVKIFNVEAFENC